MSPGKQKAMTSIINKGKNENVSITELISTCVDACSRGCQVIRSVDEKRKREMKKSDIGDADIKKDLNVVYKVADDPRSALTEADLASQRVILHCLRYVWGEGLNIIGEEDGDDGDKRQEDSDEDLFPKYNIQSPKDAPIQFDLCPISTSSDSVEDTLMLSVSDLTLYIDPMDGTREFVEGRLHNVQCLIGITWKGRPIGGIIGLPFLWNDDGEKMGGVYVVSGLNWGKYSFVNTICVGEKGKISHEYDTNFSTPQNREDLLLSLGKPSSSSNDNHDKIPESNVQTLNVFTGDSGRLHQKYALQNLETWTSEKQHDTPENLNPSPYIGTILKRCIAGGCGNKILRTISTGIGINDGNAISVIPPGTCSWDTAAPTAILFAALVKYSKQGKVTDMFGGELVYNPTGKKVTNDLGALVSIGPMAGYYHDKISQTFRGDEVILSSLLKKYWTVNLKDLQGGGVREDINSSVNSLRIAQKEPQAIDFARGEKGYFMTCAEVKSIVSEQIICCDDSELIGYSIPEKNAVRNELREGKKIDTCIIHLFWKDDDHDPNSSTSRLPASVFYERVHTDNFNFRVILTRA